MYFDKDPELHNHNTYGGRIIMVEVKNGKKILTTPISSRRLKDIKIGDIVYLNGSMTTCRDVAHRRLVEEKERTSCRCKKQRNLSCRTDHPSPTGK